jgi:hypothetical protein
MNDTTTVFEELQTILAREYEAHEHLLNAATEVNCAIKKNDLAALQKHTSNLDDKVFQIEQIEERRKECCGAISQTIGFPAGNVRLATIIDKAPPVLREKLAGLQTALKNALAKIAQLTVSNRILIEEGLAMVQGRFAIIMQSGARFTHYRHNGGRAAARLPCNPLFNRTA